MFLLETWFPLLLISLRGVFQSGTDSSGFGPLTFTFWPLRGRLTAWRNLSSPQGETNSQPNAKHLQIIYVPWGASWHLFSNHSSPLVCSVCVFWMVVNKPQAVGTVMGSFFSHLELTQGSRRKAAHAVFALLTQREAANELSFSFVAFFNGNFWGLCLTSCV